MLTRSGVVEQTGLTTHSFCYFPGTAERSLIKPADRPYNGGRRAAFAQTARQTGLSQSTGVHDLTWAVVILLKGASQRGRRGPLRGGMFVTHLRNTINAAPNTAGAGFNLQDRISFPGLWIRKTASLWRLTLAVKGWF